MPSSCAGELDGLEITWKLEEAASSVESVNPATAGGHCRDSGCADAEVSGLPRLSNNAMCQLPTL